MVYHTFRLIPEALEKGRREGGNRIMPLNETELVGRVSLRNVSELEYGWSDQ